MAITGTPRARANLVQVCQDSVQSDGEMNTKASTEPWEVERGCELFIAWAFLHPDEQWHQGCKNNCTNLG